MKTFNDLTAGEIISLRINRRMAYKAGQYTFRAPDVCSVRWDDEAWMNWVQFNNPELTGFLPYASTSQSKPTPTNLPKRCGKQSMNTECSLIAQLNTGARTGKKP